MGKRRQIVERTMKMRVGTAEVSDKRSRRVLLALFAAGGVLFLWAPTRWMTESFQRYGLVRDAAGTGGSGQETANPFDLARPLLLEKKDASADPAVKKPRAVVFRLLAPAARAVHVGGTFNDFDARHHPLTRRSDGLWEVSLDLRPGRYLYKFKVDGRWELDPTNPRKTPDPRSSSVLEIQ